MRRVSTFSLPTFERRISAYRDGRWQTYNKANTKSGLSNDHVWALAPSVDGALWIGTTGGLTRLDRDGRWQTLNTANAKSRLAVLALAPSADGVLWIGTEGGLARLDKYGRW